MKNNKFIEELSNKLHIIESKSFTIVLWLDKPMNAFTELQYCRKPHRSLPIPIHITLSVSKLNQEFNIYFFMIL